MSKVAIHRYANVDVNSWALRVRMIRESLGLSRPKFAELINVAPTSLKNWELGYREVSWDMVRKLLDCTATEATARAIFIDLPALTPSPDLGNGQVQYTIPKVTGVTAYSPQGAVMLIANCIAEAQHAPLPSEFTSRWCSESFLIK